jgi:HlyD family secretion protein
MHPTFPPWKAGVAAALLVAASFALAQDKDKKKGKEAAPRPALTVTVVAPTSADVPLRLEANGNVAAWQEAIVGAETGGLRLTDVKVNVGDGVKRGDTLATFNADNADADVKQQAAGVAEAEAALAEARANQARGEKLVAPGAISQQEIDKLRSATLAAEARLAAAKAAVDASRVRLRQTRVLAPDNGVISARLATVGAVVQPGQELFRLIRDNRLEWRAEVTAADLARVKQGQRVALTLPGGGTATGKVRMLAPTIDPQTRNALVYVDITSKGEARAGMFARGEFDLGKSGATTVPQQAVVVRDGYSYVFVVGSDNRAAQKRVKAGRRVGDRIEILEGLPAGASVVAAGAGFLNDGDLVAVTQATAPPAPATAAPAAKK